MHGADYFLVVHTLWSDNTDRTFHAFPKLIGGCYNTAVLHGFNLIFITDVNLDPIGIVL